MSYNQSINKACITIKFQKFSNLQANAKLAQLGMGGGRTQQVTGSIPVADNFILCCIFGRLCINIDKTVNFVLFEKNSNLSAVERKAAQRFYI